MTQSSSKVLFRFAHISDLHFFKLTFNPLQLFSKRWLGNLNVFLSRRHTFDPDTLTTLFPLLHSRQIHGVFITGDLSSTSQEKEFEMARQFVEGLKMEGFSVFTLPGNHDQYTKGAYKKKTFYRFFDSSYDTQCSYSLNKEGVTGVHLGQQWWLVALDTAIATPLFSSNGLFSYEIEQNLEALLSTIPDTHSVILLNHFPIFSIESSRKGLLRKEALKALLERHKNIKLFLHGHSHRHCIADLRPSRLPIMLDSGSTGFRNAGSLNLIEITEQGCSIEGLKKQYKGNSVVWEPFIHSHFQWKTHETLV